MKSKLFASRKSSASVFEVVELSKSLIQENSEGNNESFDESFEKVDFLSNSGEEGAEEEEGMLNFCPDKVSSDKFDQKKIDDLKKRTMEEIDQILFKISAKDLDIDKETNAKTKNLTFESSKYPLFVTLIDFYKKTHPSFFQSYRFKVDSSTHKIMNTHKKQSYSEFLEEQTLSKFSKIQNKTHLNLSLLYKDYSIFSSEKDQKIDSYYSELMTQKTFMNQFIPILKKSQIITKFGAATNQILEDNGFLSPNYLYSLVRDQTNSLFQLSKLDSQVYDLIKKYKNKLKSSRIFLFEKKGRKKDDENDPQVIQNKLLKHINKSFKDSCEYIKNGNFYHLRNVSHMDQVYRNFETIERNCLIMNEIKKLYYRFKSENHYYDYVDIFEDYQLSPKMNKICDFMYVDEIQDVPVHVIKDLQSKFKYQMILYGDNAQNITKGYSFKFKTLFQDLIDNRDGYYTKESSYKSKRVIVKYPISQYKFIQLKKNFRSHQQILNFANSVVRILENLQRGDLDIMQDEISEKKGHLPIIISSEIKYNKFLEFLTQKLGLKINQNGRIQFGPDQAILVRNQESKLNLPEELKDAMCFTILESKGLEFSDVFLFNFFTETPSYKCWKLTSKVKTTTLNLNQKQYNNMMEQKSRSENGMVNGLRIISSQIIEIKEDGLPPNSGNEYKIRAIDFQKKMKFEDKELYDEINDELKQLYVAITRVKNNFVVFDSDNRNRIPMENIWRELKVVKFIDRSSLKNIEDSPLMNSSSELEIHKAWNEKAFQFFRKEQYQYALICFRNIEVERGIKLCKACLAIQEIQRSEDISQSKDIQDTTIQRYLEAATHFKNSGNLNEAGYCYINGKDYKNGKLMFKEVKNWKRVLDILLIEENYISALLVFEEIGEESVIKDQQLLLSKLLCLGSLRKYEEIFKLLGENWEETNSESTSDILNNTICQYIKQLEIEFNQEISDLEIVKEDNVIMDSDNDFSSFEDFSSNLSSKERFSESFININSSNNEDDLSRAGSIFEPLGLTSNYQNSCPRKIFIHEKYLSKLSLLTSLLKKPLKTLKFSSIKISNLCDKKNSTVFTQELPTYEFDNTTTNTILNILSFNKCQNLFRVVSESYNMIGRIVQNFLDEAFRYSIIANTDTVYKPSINQIKKIEVSSNEQRRITSMMFKELLQEINPLILKNENIKNNIVQSLMMLGYIRQCIHLVEYEQKLKIAEFLGDIELFGGIYADENIDDLEERNSFIEKAMKENNFNKVVMACRTKSKDNKMIKTAIFNLMIQNFWSSISIENGSNPITFTDRSILQEKLPIFSLIVELINSILKDEIMFNNVEENSKKLKKIISMTISYKADKSIIGMKQESNADDNFKSYEFGLTIGIIVNLIYSVQFRTYMIKMIRFNFSTLSMILSMVKSILEEKLDNESKKGFGHSFGINFINPEIEPLFGYIIEDSIIIHKTSPMIKSLDLFYFKQNNGVKPLLLGRYIDNSSEFIMFTERIELEEKELEKSWLLSSILENLEKIKLKLVKVDKNGEVLNKKVGYTHEFEEIATIKNIINSPKFKILAQSELYSIKYDLLTFKSKKLIIQDYEEETENDSYYKNNLNFKNDSLFGKSKYNQKDLQQKLKRFIPDNNLNLFEKWLKIQMKEFNSPIVCTSDRVIYMNIITIIYERVESLTYNLIFLALMASVKIDDFTLFHRLSSKYKRSQHAVNKFNFKEIFFNLIDAEMSLKAGCVNEYLASSYYNLQSIYQFVIPSLVLAYFHRHIFYFISSSSKDKSESKYLNKTQYYQNSRTRNCLEVVQNEMIEVPEIISSMDALRDIQKNQTEISNFFGQILHNVQFKGCSQYMMLNLKSILINNYIIDDDDQLNEYLSNGIYDQIEHDIEEVKFSYNKTKTEEGNVEEYYSIIKSLQMKSARYQWGMNIFRKYKNIFIKKKNRFVWRVKSWKDIDQIKFLKKIKIVDFKNLVKIQTAMIRQYKTFDYILKYQFLDQFYRYYILEVFKVPLNLF